MAVEPRVFEGLHSSITIVRTAPEVVLVTMTGHGIGELRPGPLRTLDEELTRGTFALFIDARGMPGVSTDVSKDWAQWLKSHRDELRGMHLLTASRLMHMTAAFVQRFAELGGAMTLYDDVAAFNRALVRATCPPAGSAQARMLARDVCPEPSGGPAPEPEPRSR